MFAVLAHHLCTALVPLNVNFTFRTALDWCIVLFILIERAGKKKDTSFMFLVLFTFYIMIYCRFIRQPKSFNIQFAADENALMQ